MHEYRIRVNGGCLTKEPYIYRFGRTGDIKLHVKRGKGEICYAMTVKKGQEEMIGFEQPLLRDAYRKLFLLHGILFDSNLNVKQIEIEIDGESVICDENTEGFPFIYSMISRKPMNLPKAWRERSLCERIVSDPKSKSSEDRQQIALLAFLSAKGHSFAVDRFSNLWTSMNAFYSWYADIYNDYIKKEYGYDLQWYEDRKKKLTDEKKEEFQNIWKMRPKLENLKLVIEDDANCMRWLMKSIDPSADKLGRSHFDNADMKRRRFQAQRILAEFTQKEAGELYRYAYESLKKEVYTDQEAFVQLKDLAQEMGTKLYFFLVFEFPYYCRCNYLHGSKALLLLAYKDEYEVKVLRTAGYMVEAFLEEYIPRMLTGRCTVEEQRLENTKNQKIEALSPKNQEKLEAHKKRVLEYRKHLK